MRLSLQAATATIEAAQQRAHQRNVPSAVAIVDEGGNLIAFSAHEDAILAARGLAIGKAYTALSLRADTASLGASVLPGEAFYALNTALPGQPLVTFAGGRPLRDTEKGAVIGGVGVSGGTLEDDTDISRTALTTFETWAGLHLERRTNSSDS